ncbi:hypothetical protein HELRODRAFT_74196 [Helobdella robusta]|uniref:Octanoyl-[acyl-carrier-protein]:protein N-octanoyltransferase LIPT2, mitochondrial n=1 Tax=Helobdella robusta TaxID=6412 RepID=T1G1N6_HELRO|nr:hypothetical protein HELRODRAFT_74196 [Helobdella robusta]ESO09034.1 hypothetical protein HELRODRAFT_74196 [Helobdella robusta]
MNKRPLVEVINLGLIRYNAGLEFQNVVRKKLVDEKNASARVQRLIFLEHYPTYTIGIRSRDYTKELEDKLLRSGADFHRTDRGGLITFHGLGQLVVYPIFHLKDFNLTLRKYVDQLQNVVIETASRFGLKAYTCKHVGVWVNDKKLAALGIHASHFVTTHGFAINCNTDLTWFNKIVPCGIHDKGVTSLSNELNKNITIEEVKPEVIYSFKQIFNCDFTK